MTSNLYTKHGTGLGWLLVLVVCFCIAGCSVNQSKVSVREAETTESALNPIATVSPEQARSLLKEGYIYLDVRTTKEFLKGHPPNAYNIPFFIVDKDTGKMKTNPDFSRIVNATFRRNKRIIVGCRSGKRSAMATKAMGEQGYTNTLDMMYGFRGVANAEGKIINPGWSALQFPVKEGNGYSRSYETLCRLAK